MSRPIIYFNEAKHTYTDSLSNRYVSATTLIGKYEYKFDDKKREIADACARIGRKPYHPKYEKYKNKSATDILTEWENTTKVSLVRGNERHDYLEDTVKTASGFIKIASKLPGGRLYTVYDIIENPTFGEVNLEMLSSLSVEARFPRIYKIIKALVEDGYRIYAEAGIFSVKLLISGLIDLLAIKGNKFIIVDWKTNKYPIQFMGGFYEKDNDGKITNYKITNDTMRAPLAHLQQSTGIKYSLQVSLYAYLITLLGLECEALIICQILPELYDDTHNVPESWMGKEYVNTVVIDYMKDDIELMINDYRYNREHGQLSFSVHS